MLCNPFGEEALRVHRPFKKLAEACADTGFHVLRFDYLGAGDSHGDDVDVTIESMSQSLLWADEEIRELSNCRDVIWITLGLGFWAAMRALPTVMGARKILAWDPVLCGEAYLASTSEQGADAVEGFLGFPVSQKLKHELREGYQHPVEATDITSIGAYELPEARKHIPVKDIWNADYALNAYFVPTETIRLIVEEVSSW